MARLALLTTRRCVLYTALFHLKHRFYVEILILFGDQHSKGHSALTVWNTMAQAEQNRYRNNWSKLLFQGTREDAETQLRQIIQIFSKVRNLLLYCCVYSKIIGLLCMPVDLFLIINGFPDRFWSDRT